jgi:ketosteroid isomerase-like protein
MKETTEKVGVMMQGNILSQANKALIQQYLEIATVTDDMDHFSQLIAADCVWVMMPTGHAFKGFEQVSSLAKTAGGTRAHDEKYTVKLLNWFTDGEHFCVEYHHGAIIKGLHIKGTINICLVCHMQDGKFDRIHEYVHAHGTFFKLVMSLGLRVLPLMVKRKSSKEQPAGK